jgi:hypothetical protein
MNLARHISVLWRFRAIVLIGVLLGLILAFLAAFQVPSMERRGIETWTAESDVRVTQQGFPEGRVTTCFPTSALAAPETDGTEDKPCADQGRFVQLALYYAQIAVSDEVRKLIPEKPARGQINARNVDATGNGQGWMPIVRLTTTAQTAEGAVGLNLHTIEALKSYLTTNQRDAGTREADRVQLLVLNQPAAALVSGRSLTLPLLAFMLCVIAAIAAAHIFENLRPRELSALDMDALLDLEPDVAGAANGYAHSNGHASVHEPPGHAHR